MYELLELKRRYVPIQRLICVSSISFILNQTALISVHITRNDWLSSEVSYVLVTCKVQHIDKYLEITIHVFQVEILLSVGLIRYSCALRIYLNIQRVDIPTPTTSYHHYASTMSSSLHWNDTTSTVRFHIPIWVDCVLLHHHVMFLMLTIIACKFNNYLNTEFGLPLKAYYNRNAPMVSNL